MSVGDQRPHGDVHLEVVARSAGPLGSLSVTAPVGSEDRSVAEGQQGVDFRIGDQHDRSAVPAVPSVGSASRDEFLPAKRDAPVSPIATHDGNACFVDEHG